jgi:hypothetical protein
MNLDLDLNFKADTCSCISANTDFVSENEYIIICMPISFLETR